MSEQNRLEKMYAAMQLRMVQFDTNPYVDEIRRRMRAWIAERVTGKGRKLHYLGMPSAKFYDVAEWAEFLERATAIELLENVHRHQPQEAAERFELEFTALFGDIDDVIPQGVDSEGRVLGTEFDLVFIDYWEDLFTAKHERLKTIEALVARQQAAAQDAWILALSHRTDEQHAASYEPLFGDLPPVDEESDETYAMKNHKAVLWQLAKILAAHGYTIQRVESYLYGKRIHYTFDLKLSEQTTVMPYQELLATPVYLELPTPGEFIIKQATEVVKR